MCPEMKLWTVEIVVTETANSGDSDQTAPVGVVWSGSPLFAQIYLTKYLDFMMQLNMTPYSCYICKIGQSR